MSVKVITGFLAEATARISDNDSENNLMMNFSWKPRSHSDHPSCQNPTAPLLAVDGRETLPLSAVYQTFPQHFCLHNRGGQALQCMGRSISVAILNLGCCDFERFSPLVDYDRVQNIFA